jgi:predicted nucleotidyltransferase
MITHQSLQRAIQLCKENGVTKLLLFGSAVQDPENARDIDFAVEGISGWDIIKLAAKIEMETGIDVDIVDLKRDNEFIRHIQKNARIVYAG